MADMLKAALWYQQNGYSVIPAKKNKKPFVKWQQFQKAPAGEVQIREWWDKWPGANIAILTGMKSNLTVIDVDSEAGRDAISEFLPETATFPTVKTPKGWHYYFKYHSKINNGVRVLNDCDTRGEGGYVIAPPSSNGDKKAYVWLDGLKISDTNLIQIPEFLALTLEQGSFNAKSNKISLDPLVYSEIVDDKNDTVTTSDDTIPQGRRDDTLFSLANYLVKGGMPIDNIRFYLRFFASHCDPPFPENEIEVKIKSALNRSKRSDANISEIVREYVLSSHGVILSSEVSQMSSLSSRSEKQAMSKVLSRMVDEGELERYGNKNGQFRRINRELNKIDIFNVKSEYLDIKYPLDLHELFKTMPRNVIVIAGTQNVGKTAFLMNVASMNMNRNIKIRYFTSEMGEMELVERCKMFEPDIPFSFWENVEFCDHSSGFADKIEPDGLNIIDYLEVSDSFWQVGERFKEMYEMLNKGIAIVALQKGFKKEFGRGAEFSLEKPRLYVTLESNPPEGNIAKIVKCKNWARQDINPNGKECVFNVIQGCKIRKVTRWTSPYQKEVDNAA